MTERTLDLDLSKIHKTDLVANKEGEIVEKCRECFYAIVRNPESGNIERVIDFGTFGVFHSQMSLKDINNFITNLSPPEESDYGTYDHIHRMLTDEEE